jgi:hypothetical protein
LPEARRFGPLECGHKPLSLVELAGIMRIQ